jgi:pheromone shutdown protein TraB
LVDAACSLTAGIRFALIQVHAPIIWIASVSVLAAAGVVAGVVAAQGVHSARVGQQALVDVSALHQAVPFKAWLTLADVLGWQVAAFGIRHALVC